MKRYAVKEMFSTLQGEGHHVGTSAVFVRFAGCNFWSGLEKHRHTTSLCAFCDTDFRGTDGENGGKYTAEELVATARSLDPAAPMVVLTGGEPGLQVDNELVVALKRKGFFVAMETNGSISPLPPGIDWVCCSPKSAERLKLTFANELKVIFPAQDPKAYLNMIGASHYWIQPEDGEGETLAKSTAQAIDFIKTNPRWRLSVQTHKVVGLK